MTWKGEGMGGLDPRGGGRTGHSGRQNAATRRNMRREERVTVQGPVKKQPPDGPHAHENTARQVLDDLNAEGSGQQKPKTDPCNIQHSPNTPTTGRRERGNDTSRSTGHSGRQNAATRRSRQRDERVTVQGPVKEQQPDGMSHGGGVWTRGGVWT